MPVKNIYLYLQEYKEVLDQKFCLEIELENQVQLKNDLQLELEHYQAIMGEKGSISLDKLQQHIQQFQHIKSMNT